MAQTIFKRVEIKYLITEEQYNAMLKRLEPHMQIDEYGLSDITNIYYDTDNYDIIRASMEKPVYKEKLRLRVYGKINENSDAFLELKKKYKGTVYKRRIKLKLSDAEAYMNGGVIPNIDSQIFKEIEYFVNYYKPEKGNLVKYARIAMFGKENKDIRLTFDIDLKIKLGEKDIRKDDGAEYLLPPGERLLEIKVPDAMPLWLTDILSDLKIYPVSFSKIGEGCKRFLNMSE